MSAARAQIRRPLDSRAQVTISVVDTNGAVLGIVRSPDAPIFGTDVSLQKARTAAFFSAAFAAARAARPIRAPTFVQHPAGPRAFFGDTTALTGATAFSDRAIGNISRPYFPDGEVGRPPGPFSRPIAEFNPFSTGLQSALILGNLDAARRLRARASRWSTRRRDAPRTPIRAGSPTASRSSPARCPIYRGNTLVGGIGVSGDGIDQDDMISFLGLHNGALRLGGIGNADAAIRSDQIVVPVGSSGVRLRYVSCPFAPSSARPSRTSARAYERSGGPAVPDGVGLAASGRTGRTAAPAAGGGIDRAAGPPADEALIEGRRRPDSQRDLPDPVSQDNPGAVRAPPPEAFPTDHIPVPDRWRLIGRRSASSTRAGSIPTTRTPTRATRPICIPTDEEQERRRDAGIARCATPRFLGLRERRLVLACQRDLRHGDRAAHLPDPGRRADHPAPRQQRRVRQESTAWSCRRPSSPASR